MDLSNSNRIAIYLPSLRGGGAERAMATLANGFAARGLSVDLVLANAEGPYLEDVDHHSVRVVDLQSRGVFFSLPGLVRYLRHEQPRVLFSALSHANVVAVWARGLAEIPTRLVISERANLSVTQQFSPGFRQWLVPRFMRAAYPRADRIVAVSAGVADDLAIAINLPRERISVVHNPIVTETLLRQSNEPLTHPWLAPDAPPLILAAGRLAPQKDFATLIHAFARLRSVRPARLMILGDGIMRDDLMTLAVELGAQKDVAMPGFVDNPFAWMRRSSLFVLSSAFEGLPGVLIQAMACDAPVVSTDCPSGPAEILENGRWGRLVPVGDVSAMAGAMAAALDDSAPPDVARRALDFGMDQAVDGYLDVMFGRGGYGESSGVTVP
ncbi:glycosyltransferase [Inquilinus sp. CAU 1745]|uniref:glycosyltransferase n=1 Tax=Inquilinus sp. CAU 1745 TaxID=3140369 RepID=UPI00325A9236